MFRLVTLKDYDNYESVKAVTEGIRTTFATVFSTAYTDRLGPELQKAVANQEFKEAEELKTSPNSVLKGFSDLLSKKNYFKQPLSHYTNLKELKKVFHEIYQGAGFDDEAAFILAFYDLNLMQSADVNSHYQKIKSRLDPKNQAEVEDYLNVLNDSHRSLKEVNFIALLDNKNQVIGFAIIHRMIFEGKNILHIRQAAMMQQSQGYAGIMARYLADNYATGIYEANIRKANKVLMKFKLVKEDLLEFIDAVLNYNSNYYSGLRGKKVMLDLFLEHQKKNHPSKKLFSQFGQRNFEAESIIPFFSHVQLHRDLIAKQDDNYCHEELSYLHIKPFKI